MAAVAQRYGETGAAPYLIPISVDGLVVVASVCLVELAGRIRAVGSDPVQVAAGPVNSAPSDEPSAQVTPAVVVDQSREPDTRPADVAIESARPVDERAARKATALAALARPTRNVEAIAAAAGVTVETLQRWADAAASNTRRPRGGPRKTATTEESGVNGAAVPQLLSHTE